MVEKTPFVPDPGQKFKLHNDLKQLGTMLIMHGCNMNDASADVPKIHKDCLRLINKFMKDHEKESF